MKTLAACLLLGLTLFALAGCPEKKPEEGGAHPASPATPAAPAKPAASAAPGAKPAGGGW